MLLLTRPPYIRWAAALVLVTAAFGWDLTARASEPFPVAATDIPRGAPISDDVVAWVDVPRGSLPLPDLTQVTALTDIARGDPITRSMTTAGSVIPPDWWSVPMNLPSGITVGSTVRLTMLDGHSVDGIVSLAPAEDAFGLTTSGAVAVPEDAVGDVTVAVATDSVVVVVAP